MKRMKKSIAALFLVLTMLLSVVQVQAATTVTWKDSNLLTLYSSTAVKDWPWANFYWLCTVSGKITDLKSSNPAVLTVEKSYYEGQSEIYTTVKKKGTTTVSFKVGKKTYSKQFVVKGYVNPVKSIVVGPYNFPVKRLNGTSVYNAKQYKFASKTLKTTIKLKDTWKLVSLLCYEDAKEEHYKNYKNGANITYNKGKGASLMFFVKHKVTGREEQIIIFFK